MKSLVSFLRKPLLITAVSLLSLLPWGIAKAQSKDEIRAYFNPYVKLEGLGFRFGEKADETWDRHYKSRGGATFGLELFLDLFTNIFHIINEKQRDDLSKYGQTIIRLVNLGKEGFESRGPSMGDWKDGIYGEMGQRDANEFYFLVFRPFVFGRDENVGIYRLILPKKKHYNKETFADHLKGGSLYENEESYSLVFIGKHNNDKRKMSEILPPLYVVFPNIWGKKIPPYLVSDKDTKTIYDKKGT